MKVKWQSDAPNMELVIPTGQYLPYELPVATKEVLGGVKVDGDTINITSDGVISTQKVDLSGVATKIELKEIENKIPDTSGLATKIELATVENKIPDTSGLATKTELTAVENKIPDVSGFATKDEIPNVSGLATKVELNEVAATIPNSDDLATKAELNAVQSSIPDTSGLATKVELSNIEAKIPDISDLATKVELSNVAANIPETYLEVANLGDGSLTIINNKGESVIFTPSTGGAVDSVNGQTGTVVLDIPTKVSELENDSGYLTSHQDISNLATKVELSTVEAKIPDTSNFATKVELQTVEGSIPSEYLKNASVADNKLTITKSSGDTIEFSGGSGGGGVQLNYNIWSTSTFTEQDKEVIKSAIKFGTGFCIDRCQVIRTISIGSRRIFIIWNPNGATDNHVIGYQIDIDNDMSVTSSGFTKFIDYVLVGSNSAISGDIITSDNWQTYISLDASEWIKADGENDSNLYNARQLWVVLERADGGNSGYCQGIFRFDNSNHTVLGDWAWQHFYLTPEISISYAGSYLSSSSSTILAIYYKT